MILPTRAIHWYPGHMEKTFRQMKEALKRVDFVIEVCDARVARSSRNPELLALTEHKDRMLLLNKADLADPDVTAAWIDKKKEDGVLTVGTNLHNRSDIANIRRLILEANKARIERAKARGYVSRPLRLMIAGIPNSGKSTLINRLAGKSSLKTQNKPGVTRQLVWLRAGKDLELLDTPGVLWPKLDTEAEKCALAASGAIPDDLLPKEEVAACLLNLLLADYEQILREKYGMQGDVTLHELAVSQHLILSGGEPDLFRTATRFINDFRQGSIGRLSLERP